MAKLHSYGHFFGDSLKGVAVVLLGRLWHLEEWVINVGATCVIFGHLFPVWLKFNGGKGVATFIGVGLALSTGLFFLDDFRKRTCVWSY